MTQDLFNSWFEQALLPELGPGTTIILDNASAHKSPKILDIARSYGCKVLFLPPYSPDLNPIEKFWVNLKKAINLSSEFVRPNFSGLQFDLVPLFGTLTNIEKEVFHESEKSLYAGVQI